MFTLLETFNAVYETQSFTKAAEHLFVSQPTVTMRVKKLEAEFQTPLFERRSGQDVLPTNAAKILYDQLNAMKINWEKIKAEVMHEKHKRLPFKIVTSNSTATSILPKLLQHLLPYLPKLKISIEMHNSASAFALIANHDAQLGIIERPLSDPLVNSFVLAKDQLVLAGDPSQGVFFIREIGSGVNYYTQQYLRNHAIKPDHMITVNNNDIIIAQLRAGLGQSVISDKFVTPDMAVKDLGPDFVRDFYGIMYAQEKDPLILEIVDHIKQALPLP